MRHATLLSLVFIMGASLAFAQAGSLGVYADMGGTDCNLADDTAGLCTFWVVHGLTSGATGSRFAVPKPACFLGFYLADLPLYAGTFGNTQAGVQVDYGACLAGPVPVIGLDFFCQAFTPPCCYYPVVADPGAPSGTIEVTDCASNTIPGVSAQIAVINSNSSCLCGSVSAGTTTWGGVKSLFAD